MSPTPPTTWRSYSMTFAPRAFAALSIAIEEPKSSETRMTTFAPLARHWSACERCFCGSASALVTTYETPALLAAAMNAGRSCVSQRTDVFGSGSRKHRSALCAAPFVFAKAPPTVVLMTTAPRANTTMSFFTPSLLFLVGSRTLSRPLSPFNGEGGLRRGDRRPGHGGGSRFHPGTGPSPPVHASRRRGRSGHADPRTTGSCFPPAPRGRACVHPAAPL